MRCPCEELQEFYLYYLVTVVQSAYSQVKDTEAGTLVSLRRVQPVVNSRGWADRVRVAVGSAPTIQHGLAAIKNRQRVCAPVPRVSKRPVHADLWPLDVDISAGIRGAPAVRSGSYQSWHTKEAAAESGKRALAKIRDFLLGGQKSFYPLSNKSRISGRARLSGRSYDSGSSLMTAKGWRPVLTPR
jgi:hypothetical protein